MWPEVAPSPRSEPGTTPASNSVGAQAEEALQARARARQLDRGALGARVGGLGMERGGDVGAVGGEAGANVGGVVGRRSLGDEAEAGAVLVVVEQRRDQLRRRLGRLRPVDAEDDQAVDPAAHLGAVLQVGRR